MVNGKRSKRRCRCVIRFEFFFSWIDLYSIDVQLGTTHKKCRNSNLMKRISSDLLDRIWWEGNSLESGFCYRFFNMIFQLLQFECDQCFGIVSESLSLSFISYLRQIRRPKPWSLTIENSLMERCKTKSSNCPKSLHLFLKSSESGVWEKISSQQQRFFQSLNNLGKLSSQRPTILV